MTSGYLDQLAASRPIRLAGIATLALAATYVVAVLYRETVSYGLNSDAAFAVVEDLNADTYDMAWTMAGRLGVGANRARRSLSNILICAPRGPLNPNDALTIAERQDSIIYEARNPSSNEYAELSTAIENGAKHLAIEVIAESPNYRILESKRLERGDCKDFDPSLRDVFRVPAPNLND